MSNSNDNSTTFICLFVFFTWNGKRFMTDEIRRELLEVMRTRLRMRMLASHNDSEILTANGDASQIQVTVRLQLFKGTIDRCACLLKGSSSAYIRRKFPELKAFPAFWSKGYSASLVPDEELVSPGELIRRQTCFLNPQLQLHPQLQKQTYPQMRK